MALSDEEKMKIGLDIKHELAETPYACSSLEPLGGGTANFLFRGHIIGLSPNRSKTLIVKHTKGFVSANRDFQLEVSRSMYEVAVLEALYSFRPPVIENVSIKTPLVFYFDDATGTQLLEDLTGTIDVKTMLVSPDASTRLPSDIATAVGHSLGVWLKAFHSWVSEPAQSQIARFVSKNEPMRKIRYDISYGAFIEVVQKFPEIWKEKKKELLEVREMANAEYASTPGNEIDENWGIIHGDFWAGNILMPDIPGSALNQAGAMKLFIIDWELAQFGRREYDLGQLIGDLYERKHFNGAESALRIIEGFVAAYGGLSDDMAFRVAIHVGVHLICWYIRRDPNEPFREPAELIEGAVRIGTEYVVRGWEKDRKCFEGSELVCLFN